MNNNRNNNRRRGRGNNRQQGGQQLNRIDSRARGNAPQLLEKYRKLAHDAHLNGDRVTEEYYLQFADHYFRVIADQRQRQEENRQPRRDERSSDYGEDYAEDDFYGETSAYDRVSVSNGASAGGDNRAPRQDRDRGERPERPEREARDGRSERAEREPRGEREPRAERQAAPELAPPLAPAPTSESDEGERSIYEPTENPFLREGRGPRTARTRKPRRSVEGDTDAPVAAGGDSEPTGNLDPASLPPSIGARRDEDGGEDAPAKPRRRTRRAAPPADDASGTLEVVS